MTDRFESAILPFTDAERGEQHSLPEALDSMGKELRQLRHRDLVKRYDIPGTVDSRNLDLRKLGESGS